MKNNIINSLILLPYFYLFIFIAILPGGEKNMVVVALISIFASLAVVSKHSIKQNLSNYTFWIFLLFTAFISLKYLLQSASPSMLRAALSVSLLMIIFPLKLLNQRSLMWMSFIGSIVLTAFISYHLLYLGTHRGDLLLNAIPYSTLCGTIAVLALYQFIETKKLLPIATTLLSISSILISETRGIWLALLCALSILLFFYLRTQKKRWRILGAMLIVFFSISFIFQDQVTERYERTEREYAAIQRGDYGTSIGLRFQMWEAATEIGKRNLWVGVGSEHKKVFLNLVDEGLVEPSLAKFHPDQYHNQFFENFAKMGIIGLIFTLMLFLVPLYYAVTKRNEKSSLIFSLVAFYFIACLTDSPLWYAETTLMYMMLIIPLCNDQLSFKPEIKTN
ncbi:O-antigen ligase family protein [Vibrio sp. 1CM2L]|uniref:O-antigen ligase family protein n=1 Tax=Vibrio sp. 1CM2L TaxID=2929166 RepID=UPI0020C15346|nr:O-antigen ligase family protein [Vibrio sp. 1CM2L]MCK8078673.1 O-antigen ligase family protein [Vibrio sp. 1CM2L]